MFWGKKSPPQKPSHTNVLGVYLSGVMPLVIPKCSDPCTKAGIQVFILGMADKLRQTEKLDWPQFISVFSGALSRYGLIPLQGADEFARKVGASAPNNKDIEKLMRYGAQSIQMFVHERDANAPSDLISTVVFLESNGASFSHLTDA